jgi:hypothetical protein
MLFVSLFPSGNSNEGDAPRLARTLGRTEYEARQWLALALPRVVGRFDDRVLADRCTAALRHEGFDAATVDSSEIVPAKSMVKARVPVIEATGVRPNGSDSDKTPWTDFVVFVRARARTTAYRSAMEPETIYEPVTETTRRVVREDVTRESLASEVLYLFPRFGRPWLIHESGVRFAALGVPLRPSRRDNFLVLVDRIRASAPGVPVSEALVRHVPPTLGVTSVRDTEEVAASPDHLLDVAAHLCALWVARRGESPFRQ